MDQFRFGRATAETCEWADGLMPDPEKGCDDVNAIFKEHLFKYKADGSNNPKKDKKRLTAAIMGAHTLGSAKIDNSGYDG